MIDLFIFNILRVCSGFLDVYISAFINFEKCSSIISSKNLMSPSLSCYMYAGMLDVSP